MTVASYSLPASVPEALDLLARHGPDLLVISGGTVAMPLINEGLSMPAHVMGLRRAGLDRLEVTDGTLRIGAATTLTRLLEQETIPLLSEAASQTGSWAVRNMATVGGNLFTPPPGGDVAVALLALDADAVLTSRRGERLVPLTEFFTGFLSTALADDELLTELRVPIPAGTTAFRKFGRKHGNTPAVVTVAAHVSWDGGVVADARVALGAAGPHSVRARSAERAVIGTALGEGDIALAAAQAMADSEPFTDAIATDWYRRRMVGVFVTRALEALTPGTTTEVR